MTIFDVVNDIDSLDSHIGECLFDNLDIYLKVIFDKGHKNTIISFSFLYQKLSPQGMIFNSWNWNDESLSILISQRNSKYFRMI